MATEAQMIGYELIKTGSLVSFRIVEEAVLAAPDEAEFGMRLLLRFVAEKGEDDQDEDDGLCVMGRTNTSHSPSWSMIAMTTAHGRSFVPSSRPASCSRFQR